MEETWKVVPKFFGKYLASDKGNIKHYKDGLLPQYDHPKGYKTVVLYLCGNKYTKGVHRVVASAFIDNPDNKEQINHKNLSNGIIDPKILNGLHQKKIWNTHPKMVEWKEQNIMLI